MSKNRVVGWANINAPGLKGDGPLTYLTNGWSIKPYVQVQNGLPYSLLSSGTAVQQCSTPGCLVAASSGVTGTGATAYLPFFGRNTLQFPRTIEIDLRAQKSFKFAEKYNLELFGEAFNLANHQNVTGVNSTGYAITGTSRYAGGVLTYQANFGSPRRPQTRTLLMVPAWSRSVLGLLSNLAFVYEGGGFSCRPSCFKRQGIGNRE